MAIRCIYLIVLTAIAFVHYSNNALSARSSLQDPYANKARIQSRNGHLILQAGLDKNIDLRSSGKGSVTLNGLTLDTLISASKSLQNLNLSPAPQDSPQQQIGDGYIQQLIDKRLSSKLEPLQIALGEYMRKVDKLYESLNKFPATQQINKTIKRVKTLTRDLDKLQLKLNKDECSQNPCKNGGTCLDAYDGYRCLCPSNFDGPNCDNDINECLKFLGTDLGCQNGAKCINIVGSYRCECPANYHGIHCTEQHDDCTLSSSQSLCGHGKCINLQRQVPNQARYECICDQGWTTNGHDPACTVDINECSSYPLLAGTSMSYLDGVGALDNSTQMVAQSVAMSFMNSISSSPWHGAYPCSQSPLVECINLPGGFQCGPCPPGFVGNGRVCRDIDECKTNNGGCSPLVDCINLPGSRKCGLCPPGFAGDGLTCQRVSACQSEPNGGCHPMAQCLENTAISMNFRHCVCSPPYVGSGVGDQGCLLPVAVNEPQQPNAINFGTGEDAGQVISIVVTNGTGQTQQKNVSVVQVVGTSNCLPLSPCKNGGSCFDTRDSFECICPSAYTGRLCDQLRPSCGGLFETHEGSVSYPLDFSLVQQIRCEWSIKLPTDKAIMLTFDQVDLLSSPTSNLVGKSLTAGPETRTIDNCNDEYLTITDVPPIDGEQQMLGRICPNDVKTASAAPGNQSSTVPKKPPFKVYNSTHNQLNIVYKLNISQSLAQPALDGAIVLRTFSFRFRWQQMEPVCHFDYPVQEFGYVSSPNYPHQYPKQRYCTYYIRVPAGKRIRLHFGALNLGVAPPVASATPKESARNCRGDELTIYDGISRFHEELLLYKYCSSSAGATGARLALPAPILTSGSTAEIFFNSDTGPTNILSQLDKSAQGFYITYAAEPGIQNCGGLFSGPSGVIVSPYFSGRQQGRPDAVATGEQLMADVAAANRSGLAADDATIGDSDNFNMRCEWEIRTSQKDKYVKIRFDLLEFVGTSAPAIPQSRMMRAGWDKILTKHRTQTDWSAAAGDMSKHTFRLGGGPGAGAQANARCVTTSIKVYDGSHSNAALLGKYCESEMPDKPIESSGRSLYIVYESSDRGAARGLVGFRGQYKLVCSGSFRDQVDLFYGELPPNVDWCLYDIRLPKDYIIVLLLQPLSLGWRRDGPTNNSCEVSMIFIDGAMHHQSLDHSTGLPKDLGYKPAWSDTDATSDDSLVARKAASAPASGVAGEFKQSQLSWAQTYDIKEVEMCWASFSYESEWNHLQLLVKRTPGARNQNATMVFRAQYRGERACGGIISEPAQGSIELKLDDLVEKGETGVGWDKLVAKVQCSWILRANSSQRIELEFLPDHRQLDEALAGYQRFIASDNNEITRAAAPAAANSSESDRTKRSQPWPTREKKKKRISFWYAASKLPETPYSKCAVIFNQVVELHDPNTNQTRSYCPSQLPPTMVSSSGNVLHIRVREYVPASQWSRRVSSRPNKWLPQPLEVIPVRYKFSDNPDQCGGNIIHDSGTIVTPNYPDRYPAGAQCTWTIHADNGQQIRLNFSQFALERQSKCLFDYLELRNGPNKDSPLIGRFCGKQLQSRIILSHSNNVWLQFRSDATFSAPGFRMSFDGALTGCGGKLTTASGEIESPNYPRPYGHQADCSWSVEVSQSSVVLLTLEDLWLGGSGGAADAAQAANCNRKGDYLEIFDGDYSDFSANKLSLGKWCANSSLASGPVHIRSSGNKVQVRFVSAQARGTGRGFRLTYVTDCDFVAISGYQGAIESPNYPNTYAPQLNCHWLLRAPLGSNISMSVVSLKLEYADRFLAAVDQITSLTANVSQTAEAPTDKSMRPWCVDDFVQIWALNSSNSKLTKELFWQDQAQARAANGSQSQRQQQQGLEAMKSGRTPDTEAPPRGATLVRIMCGDLRDKTHGDDALIELNTNLALVRFRTDRTFERQGFRLEWRSVGCGGHLSNEWSQEIRYFLSEDRPVECIWTVASPLSSASLALHALESDIGPLSGDKMAPPGDCSTGYLNIYAGDSETAPLLLSICQRDGDRQLPTTSNKLYIKFFSAGLHWARGFRLNYFSSSGSRSCSRSMTPTLNVPLAMDSFLTSPNYPSDYDSNENWCEYDITVPHYNRIRMRLEELDIPVPQDWQDPQWSATTGTTKPAQTGIDRADPCGSKSFLLLQEVLSLAARWSNQFGQLAKYCGQWSPPAYTGSVPDNSLGASLGGQPVVSVTRESRARVVFQTKGTLAGKWKLSYGLLCGSEVRVRQNAQPTALHYGQGPAIVETPNYPNRPNWYQRRQAGASSMLASDREQMCLWHLISEDPGDKIVVSITHLVESSRDKRSHCVRLFEGTPFSLNMTEFPLTNAAESAGAASGAGADSGTNSSIRPRYVLCDNDDIVAKNEFVSVGPSMSLVTTGDVVLRSIVRNTNGFCGGDYWSQRGSFASPNYPNSYEPNMDCNYFVKASPGHTITLEFVDFDLQDSEHCNLDYVEVRQLPMWKKQYLWSTLGAATGAGPLSATTSQANRPVSSQTIESVGRNIKDSSHNRLAYNTDSLWEESVLIGRYCGTKKPELPHNVTLTDEVWIRFRTDDTSQTGKGFRLEYTIHYGMQILATRASAPVDYGIISSPMYPMLTKLDASISWHLETEEGDQLELELLDLNLGSIEQDCDLDAILIYDFEPKWGRPLATLCGYLSYEHIATSASANQNQNRAPVVAARDPRVRQDLSRRLRSRGNWLYVIYQNKRSEGRFLMRWSRVSASQQSLNLEPVFAHVNGSSANVFVPEPGAGPQASGRPSDSCHFTELMLNRSEPFELSWPPPANGADPSQANSSAGESRSVPKTGQDDAGLTVNRPADGDESGLPAAIIMSDFRPNSSCSWTFVTRPGSHFQVDISELNLDSFSEACYYERLQFEVGTAPSLADGPGDIAGGSDFAEQGVVAPVSIAQADWSVNRTLCGRRRQTFRLASNMARITYVHRYQRYQEAGTGSGQSGVVSFKLTLKPRCGGLLENYRQYRLSQYDVINSTDCQWLIRVRPGRRISLSFSKFLLPNSNSNTNSTLRDACLGASASYFTLYNGPTDMWPQFGSRQRLCGTKLPVLPAESFSNELLVQFHRGAILPGPGRDAKRATDVPDTYNGVEFALAYRELSQSCSDSVKLSSEQPSFELRSPNWPQAPPHDIECNWLVYTDEHSIIRLDFDTSATEEALIQQQAGAEMSTNYLAGQQQCDASTEFVAVYDGGSTLSHRLVKYCLPPRANSVKSTDNHMFVRFVTNPGKRLGLTAPGADPAGARVALGAFKARVTINDCGGTYHVVSGLRLQSKNYPRNYTNNRDCKFYLHSAAPQQTLIAQLYDVDLAGQSADCSTGDYLEFRDGDTSDAPLLARWCNGKLLQMKQAKQASEPPTGNNGTASSRLLTADIQLAASSDRWQDTVGSVATRKQQAVQWGPDGKLLWVTVKSTGPVITVIFKTDNAVSGRGFHMFVSSSTADEAGRTRCGGHLDETDRSLQSPNFPQPMPQERTCSWTMKVPEWRGAVKLTFDSLNLKQNQQGKCVDKLYYSRMVDYYDRWASLSGDAMDKLVALGHVKQLDCKLSYGKQAADSSDSAADRDQQFDATGRPIKRPAVHAIDDKAGATSGPAPVAIRSTSNVLLVRFSSKYLAQDEGFSASFSFKEDKLCSRSLVYPLSPVDGPASAGAASVGGARWEAIPDPFAAPADSGGYFVSGRFNQTDDGTGADSADIDCYWPVRTMSNWKKRTSYVIFDVLEIPVIGNANNADSDTPTVGAQCGMYGLTLGPTDLPLMGAVGSAEPADMVCGNKTGQWYYHVFVPTIPDPFISLHTRNLPVTGGPPLSPANQSVGAFYRGVRGRYFEQDCGGRLYDFTGKIASHTDYALTQARGGNSTAAPVAGSYSPRICKWDVHSWGSLRELRFDSFNLRPTIAQDKQANKQSTGCLSEDFVEIRSGVLMDSPLVVRYCAEDANTAKLNNDTVLTMDDRPFSIIFVGAFREHRLSADSDGPAAARPAPPAADLKSNVSRPFTQTPDLFGFQMDIRTIVDGVCGQKFYDYLRGTIRSPRERDVQTGPRWGARMAIQDPLKKYANNTRCVYDISLPPGYRVNMSFFGRFELEKSDDCANDYVQLEDPLFAGAQVGGNSSGSGSVPDVSINSDGQMIVDDGPRRTQGAPVLGKFCGFVRPGGSFVTSNNRARITFKSNDKIEGAGYKLNYEAVCGGLFTVSDNTTGPVAARGVLTSPHYPRPYDNNLNCEYTIRHERPGRFVMVKFEDFELEQQQPEAAGGSRQMGGGIGGGANRGCLSDYVYVYARLTSANDTSKRVAKNWRKLGPYCGKQTIPSVFGYEQIKVFLHTNGYARAKGFKLVYESSQCGGQLTEPSGMLAPFSGGGTYLPDMNCVWTITVARDRIVELVFNRLELESCDSCGCDSVELRDTGLAPSAVPPRAAANKTRTPDDGLLLGRFCGTYPGGGSQLPVVKSKSNVMQVKFSTDFNLQSKGFEATYRTSLGERQGCGGRLHDSDGVIVSPDADKDGNYDNQLDCWWLITVPNKNKLVRLDFVKFDLEAPQSPSDNKTGPGAGHRCVYDYLEIRDGLSHKSGLIDRVCGSEVPAPMQSSAHALYVHFHTDTQNVRAGFRLKFSSVERDCGGIVWLNTTEQTISTVAPTGQQRSPTRTLASPNFPLAYPPLRRCVWQFELVSESDQADQAAGANLTTLSDRALLDRAVMMVIDKHLNSMQWSALFERLQFTAFDIDCAAGDYLELESQIPVLTSGSNGQIIDYEATSMLQPSSGNSNRANYYSGTGDTARLCGQRIPQPIYVSDGFRMTFVSSRLPKRGQPTGFQITYRDSSVCNETINDDNGVLMTPVKYRTRGIYETPAATATTATASDCVIDLRAPTPKHRIVLYFSKFVVESTDDPDDDRATATAANGTSAADPTAGLIMCASNYMQINELDPVTNVRRSLAKLCGRNLPNPVYTQSSHVELKLHADIVRYQITFSSAIPEPRGGAWAPEGRDYSLPRYNFYNITGYSGSVASPNYPNPFTGEQQSGPTYWLISGHGVHKLRLSWQDMSLVSQPAGTGMRASAANTDGGSGSRNKCDQNYLQLLEWASVLDRQLQSEPQLKLTLCGDQLPQEYVSQGASVLLKLVTNKNNIGRGFRLKFTEDELSLPKGVPMASNYRPAVAPSANY